MNQLAQTTEELLGLLRNGHFFRIWKKTYGKTLRNPYSKKSLKEFGEVILDTFPDKRVPISENLVLYGYYLGETIVRNVKGARWDYNNHYVQASTIQFPSEDGEGLEVNPFHQIHKFITVKPMYLSQVVEAFEYMVNHKEDIKKRPLNEWIELPGGTRIRPHQIG